MTVEKYLQEGFYLCKTVPQNEERIVNINEMTVKQPGQENTAVDQPGFPAEPVREIERICGLPRSGVAC